jgi:hypothetical protein
MRTWQVWEDAEGLSVELVEVPAWAIALSQAANAIDQLSGHVLCGNGAPGWFWRFPLGRPRYDEAGFLLNSLGGRLHDLFTWALFTDLRHANSLVRFKVGEGEAHDL